MRSGAVEEQCLPPRSQRVGSPGGTSSPSETARHDSAGSPATLSTRKPREKLYSITGGTGARPDVADRSAAQDGHTTSGGGKDTAYNSRDAAGPVIGCEVPPRVRFPNLRLKIHSIDFERGVARPQGAAHLPVDAPAPSVSRWRASGASRTLALTPTMNCRSLGGCALEVSGREHGGRLGMRAGHRVAASRVGGVTDGSRRWRGG